MPGSPRFDDMFCRSHPRAGKSRPDMKPFRLLRTCAAVAALLVSRLAFAGPAEAAAHALLERVIGSAAAAQISVSLVPPRLAPDGTPIDEFTISGSSGN